MSWDIVLFNSKQKISSPEEVDESELIPTDFSSVFESYFGNIIKNKNHREVKEKDFAICYFISDELTSNSILNLYGEPAIYPVINLAIKNKWQIFDTGIGEMIDLNDPSRNGYENFQDYLTLIIKDKH